MSSGLKEFAPKSFGEIFRVLRIAKVENKPIALIGSRSQASGAQLLATLQTEQDHLVQDVTQAELGHV